jgi:chromosome segregation ATPase
MRSATGALLIAVVALTSPAFAAEAESTFVIRFESGENAALQSLESLSMTVSRAWTQLERPADWDDGACGAYSLVQRGADYRVRSPLPGEATVTVTIHPEEAVPSESRSAQALAQALLDRVMEDATQRLSAWRDRALSGARATSKSADERLMDAEVLARSHRHEWGDVATEHRMAAARLQEASADLARTRIDLAVASSRLEAARRAAERAEEAEKLRREADAIEKRIDAGRETDPPTVEKLRERIALLRQLLAEAERLSPTLADARRLVFDLEVEVVGLEARKAALQPEIVEVRKRVVELVDAAASARVIEAELAGARTTRTEKREQLRELEARLSAAAVIVVTAPTSGAPRKR